MHQDDHTHRLVHNSCEQDIHQSDGKQENQVHLEPTRVSIEGMKALAQQKK